MIDPELERRYADCVELMDAWKNFLDLVTRAYKDKTSITPQSEEAFLNAKARIAMLHDSFSASLRHDKQIGQNMLDLVNRSVGLRILSATHDAEQKKLEVEWHEVFLLLNETVSGLNEDRQELANRNEFTWRLGKLRDRIKANITAFLKSIWFKIMVGTAAVAFVIFGIPMFGIYDYDNLRDEQWAQKPLGTVFDMSRNVLGIEAPFISMDAFKIKYEALPLGDAKRDVQHLFIDQAADAVKGKVIPGLSFEDQDALAEALKKATGSASYRYTHFGKSGFMYLFWFRKTSDAKMFELNWLKGRQLATDFHAKRKVNVIAFVWCPGSASDSTAMSQMLIKDFLDPIKPL